MMTKLRESTAIIMWIVILAFVGLIVVEWGADYSGTSGSKGADTVGIINGEEISLRVFQQAMQNAGRQMRRSPTSPAMRRRRPSRPCPPSSVMASSILPCISSS